MSRVYYPRAVLLTAVVLSVVLLFAAWLGWQALPPDLQAMFTGPQLATLGFFVLVMLAMMLGIGLSHVRLDDAGLTVRNGPRLHRIGWDEIAGFRFGPNDPWAYVLLHDDPGSRPLIGVQRVDGDRARAFAADLVAAWESHRDETTR
ncbi:MAG: PH domain-containing protein [Propionicimonas sp.]